MHKKGESGSEGDGVEPDGDDLDLIQAAGADIVAGGVRVRAEEAVMVFEEEVAGDQGSEEQDAEHDADINEKVHAQTVQHMGPGDLIQNVILRGCTDVDDGRQ